MRREPPKTAAGEIVAASRLIGDAEDRLRRAAISAVDRRAIKTPLTRAQDKLVHVLANQKLR